MPKKYEASPPRCNNIYVLSDTEWKRFTAQLNSPPAPNAKLKDLLRQKLVWEE